ncbi:hypothetical protein D9M71_710250 [compost metagenome]
MLAVLEAHQEDAGLIERISHHQVLLGSLLQARGLVPTSLFNQALIDFDADRMSLGEHLIERGMITEQILQEALQEQAEEQHVAYRIAREVA